MGVNRVGAGGGLDYVGDSAIVGPFGEELADGANAGEAVLVADVDPEVVRKTRERFPFLDDRVGLERWKGVRVFGVGWGGRVAQHGDALDAPRLVVVVHRVVLGAAVVPHADRPRRATGTGR